jgi:general secretion pathway protein K
MFVVGEDRLNFKLSARKPKSRQNGVALLTALLVVALAAIAATAILSRQQIDIRRTATVLDSAQAYLYAQGAEEWARQILRRDSQQSRHDHLGEIWALRLPPTPVEGGQLYGQLEDLQSRFNLNNLRDGEGLAVVTEVAVFTRLLALLDAPRSLSGALGDWLDQDDNADLDGAEDSYYLRQQPMYRSANQPLAMVTEMRALMGMNAEIYEKLLPYVTALPQRTPINLNTTSAPVLAALLNISLLQAENLIADRPPKGYETVQDFLTELGMDETALAEAGIDLSLLDVQSQYFLLHAVADIGVISIRLSSLLARRGDKTTVLWRSL